MNKDKLLSELAKEYNGNNPFMIKLKDTLNEWDGVIKNDNKTVEFKYINPDGSIDLGVPDNVSVEHGNYRDGGCNLKFETSEPSIGISEKFSLYLFAEDINGLTKSIWKGYIQTEPIRAKKDIDKMIDFLNKLKGEF